MTKTKMKFKEDSRPLVNAYTRVKMIFTKKRQNTRETKTTLKQKLRLMPDSGSTVLFVWFTIHCQLERKHQISKLQP